jgi:hypothetical protein
MSIETNFLLYIATAEIKLVGNLQQNILFIRHSHLYLTIYIIFRLIKPMTTSFRTHHLRID